MLSMLLLTVNSSSVRASPLTYQTFLPVVLAPFTLNGKVSYCTDPVGGVQLKLRFFDGGSWSTRQVTTTASDGTYKFNVSRLDPGQAFYVLFENTSQPAWLYLWATRVFTTTDGATTLDLGTFDIKNVGLYLPHNQSYRATPITFYWTPRNCQEPHSLGQHRWHLFDPEEPVLDYEGVPNGPDDPYSSMFVLYALPPGFLPDTWYLWDVLIHGMNGGLGISYQTYWIAVSGGAIQVQRDSLRTEPGPGIEARLRQGLPSELMPYLD